MTDKLATSNHKFCLETKHLKERLELDFLELGERLYKIKADRLWEPYWSDFGEFLMEVKIGESVASRLMGIWQKFVLEYRIPAPEIAKAGGWTLVAEIAPRVENRRQAVHWLAKAQELNLTDLRRELKEDKTGVPMASCEHDFYVLRCCKGCGLRERVYEDE